MRGYDSHLIFNELDKFDVKISVIPNELEKYMAFFLNKYLLFIGSMQFMNSGLDKVVKNLADEDFKYLIEEFGSENFEQLKQKGDYPYEYMDSFERFNEKKLPAKNIFTALQRMEKFVMMVKYETVTSVLKIMLRTKKLSLFKKRYIVISMCFWKLY